MSRRTRVYVAGPISKGVLVDNIRQATDAGIRLLKAGYAPLVPHLTCYMAGHVPEILPHGTVCDDWYSADLPWVEVSDAILRLPGESTGADLEVNHAINRGVSAFRNIEQLLENTSPESSSAGGDLRYLKLLRDMAELHRRKSADYGSDADPFANIRASEVIGVPAWRGAWLRARDKIHRIDQFCLKGSLVNESVEDSLKDLAAYALIALVLLRETKNVGAVAGSS